MLYLGIDLGTTFSLTAHVNAQGSPVLFPDFHDANEFRTPSVVHVGKDGCLVGQAVEAALEDDPTLPHARFAKLALGQAHGVHLDHQGRHWRPEAVSALVLRKLMKDVAAFTAEPLAGVVITVPANFSDAQRTATQEAARLAGLPVPVLIEEPVAAATYYGHTEHGVDLTMFVYDLGGGTFDATLLQSTDQALYALATEGSNQIGGKNVDEMLMALVAQEFERVHDTPPSQDAVTQSQLRRFSTDAKLRLCRPGTTQVRKTLLLGNRTLDCLITRAQFEQMIGGLIDETLAVCERCLRSAGMDWSMVDKLMLTGGASLLPLVQEKLAAASGIAPGQMVTRQPHQAVAYGAALVAHQLFGQTEGHTLQRISAWDLGIRVMHPTTLQPAVEVMVPRHSPLPAERRKSFFTQRADQRRMIIEAVQQKGPGVEEKSLGHFAFGPIENPRVNYPVEVKLAYDDKGMVSITARDGETGHEIQQVMDEAGRAQAAELIEQRAWVQAQRIN
jgi:molecular chaperone DnaK